MGSGRNRGIPGWVWFCGLIVAAVAGLSLAGSAANRKARENAYAAAHAEDIAMFRAEYGRMKEAGTVPETHAALADGVAELATSDAASPWITRFGICLLFPVLEDGAVTGPEADALRSFQEFASANPAADVQAIEALTAKDSNVASYLSRPPIAPFSVRTLPAKKN